MIIIKMVEILKKIKNLGFGWFYWRIKQEVINPTYKPIKNVINMVLSVKKIKYSKKKNPDLLYAIYDFEVAPITYNIIEFLVLIEFLIKENNKKGFVIVFVPKKEKSIKFISDYEKIIDTESQNWRIDNIVFQTARLHPKCEGVLFLPTRKDIFDIVANYDIYPDLYDGVNIRYFDTEKYLKIMNKPNLYKGIKASSQGKRYIDQYIKAKKIDKKIVTIAIRDYRYDLARNSNFDEWAKFVEYLLINNYYPVIIPDTDNAFDNNLPFDSLYIFRDCCWNVGLRMALYESSYINMGVANGSICILLHSPDSNVIVMNCMPENSVVGSSKEYIKVGHTPGEQWKFLTSKQKMSFDEDVYANIVKEFEEYIKINYPDNL